MTIASQIIDGILAGSSDILFLVQIVVVSMAVLALAFVVGLGIFANQYFNANDDDFADSHFLNKPEGAERADPEVREAA